MANIVKLNMFAHVATLSFVVIVSFYLMTQPKIMFVYKLYALAMSMLAIYLLSQRNTYLPFLGTAAFPMALLKDEIAPSGANVTHILTFEPEDEGKRVVYWGAKPSNNVVANPWDAYQDFSNSGVARISDGRAVIKFFCPSKYNVPWGTTIDRHIHYRICCDQGLMGPVQTTYVNC